MKKFALYTFLLSSVAFAACEEDYDDWAAPQQPPHEEIVDSIGADTLGFTYQATAVAAIDFATAGDSVVLFTDSLTLPEGSELTGYEVLVDGVEITLSADKKVAAADLQDILVNKYGRRPVDRELPTRIFVYATVDGVAQTLFSDITVVAKPVAPYISPAYYIVGAPSQWDVMCVDLPFTHSGKDVYEDPVFTVTFPVTDGEYWFAIADAKTHEANDWSALLGCAEGNGNNGMEGGIARRTELGGDEGSWKVVVAGDAKLIRMTINMMDYTYKIEKLNFAEWAWLPGDQNGWNHGAAARMQSAAFDGVYTGYTYLNGGFKLTSQADWNGTNYGWATETTLSTDGGAGNLWAEEGFYAVNIDCANLTWAVTPISWGIVGDAVGSWDVDTDLSYDTTEKCLTVTLDLVGGKTIKFRADDGWDVNLGGNMEDLSYGGDNIAIAEDGNYTIKLYIERVASEKFYCTITKN